MKTKRLVTLLLALALLIGLLPMQAFAANPYLPLWERIPDGEPRVFTDPETGEQRVYVYGSHDLINIANERRYCGVDHVVWSAPVDDLSDWRHEGIVFRTTDLIGVEYISKEAGGQPRIIDNVDDYVLYAPDVVYHPSNKLYYMFLFLSGPNATGDLTSTIYVATSKSPAGPFTDPKYVCDGFDPAVLVDDVKNEKGKERVYLYWSVRETRSGWACELDPDTMMPIPGTTRGPRGADGIVTDEKTFMDQNFAPFHFFEGPSIRKIEDTYVLSYARSKNGGLAEIAYATSDNPFGSPALGSEWEYGGVIVSNKGETVQNPYDPESTVNTFTGGNNHGGLFELNGQWYQVYHRTTERGYERQSMVEPVNLYFDENHKLIIEQAEMTSMGFEKDGLNPYEPLSAATACYLFTYPNPSTANRVGIYTNPELNFDPDAEHPGLYPVYNISNQTWLGYKYFSFGNTLTKGNELSLALTLQDIQECTINIYAGDAKARYDDPEQPKQLIGVLDVPGGSTDYRTLYVDLPRLEGRKGIYLEFLSRNSGELLRLGELCFRKKPCPGGYICPSAGFYDAPAPGNWAHDGIDYCIENGLMNGVSTNRFSPNGVVTRAQLVTILYRMAGSPKVTTSGSFNDVPAGKWYSAPIEWAAANDIVNGMGDGRFNPDGAITREQIATILYRYSGSPKVIGTLLSFPDGSKAHAYAHSALVWATGEGLINGIKSGNVTNLAPQNSATRAQIASIIMRFLGSPSPGANGDPNHPATGNLIGISMPTKDLQRWNQDGANMAAQLTMLGYEVDLQFAANDVAFQINQIENMIANGAKVLIVSAIDGEALITVLKQAKAKGVTVIAYDRLILGSDAVTYYATFDNHLVGVMQGEYIEAALDLPNAGSKKYNIEFITGDPGDNNAHVFYDGAMEVLNKYLRSGVLVCRSAQMDFWDVTTEGWDSMFAQERFENILSTYYADRQLDAVLASNDSTAQGVATALACAYDNDVYPVITGQDCDIVSVINMMHGKQAMSVFKDTRDLAAKTVEMADAVMKGAEPPINDTETYDNGTGIIPTYMCPAKVCTIDDIYRLLIDSGYYTEADLAGWQYYWR